MITFIVASRPNEIHISENNHFFQDMKEAGCDMRLVEVEFNPENTYTLITENPFRNTYVFEWDLPESYVRELLGK